MILPMIGDVKRIRKINTKRENATGDILDRMTLTTDKWFYQKKKQKKELQKNFEQIQKEARELDRKVSMRNEILRVMKEELMEVKEKNQKMKSSKPTP